MSRNVYEQRRAHYFLNKEEAALDNAMYAVLWDSINWDAIQKHVIKLQRRIVKAIQNGKKHLIKKLQHLISISFYTKLLAVRKVTTNKGKRTAGVDKKLWSTQASKYKAALNLNFNGYKAQPLKRVYIEKKGKKAKRPLGIPTMYDRAMQALFTFTLEPLAETSADKRSFGFRKYRSCKDSASYIYNCLSKDRERWILEGDIKSCFDLINHDWLEKHIPIRKNVLREFLKSGYIYKGKLFPTSTGSPQGGIISPTLANMTLDGMENLIMMKYSSSPRGKINPKYNTEKVHFNRYADDFIISAKSKATLVETKNLLSVFLNERGLELSEEKTHITHIRNGFDFLGWNVRKFNSRLIIKPSVRSEKSIHNKIRMLIKDQRCSTQDGLISVLNPVIRGWCNYHRNQVAKKSFQTLDKVLFLSLWNWAKRRHPNKSRKWIVRKYWKQKGHRNWIFQGQECRLYYATDTKIRRHIMIKLDKNPFDANDSEYFTKRFMSPKVLYSCRSSFA